MTFLTLAELGYSPAEMRRLSVEQVRALNEAKLFLASVSSGLSRDELLARFQATLPFTASDADGLYERYLRAVAASKAQEDSPRG